MAQPTLQQKLKKIAAFASKLERHVRPVHDREEYLNMTEERSAVLRLSEAVRELGPEARELLEIDE